MWTPDRRVVGWFRKVEWESVYNELYSDDVQKQTHAVGRIRVWKSRVLHKLSASIDCTCSLIQSVIEDHSLIKAGQVIEKDVAIRMGYSIALVRFVNLITDKLQKKSFAQPVHRLAGTLGLPEWMVNLRHEATHGSLPQLSVLRSGAQLALAWLKREYWEAQNEWNDKEPQSLSDSPAPTDSVEDMLVSYMQQQYQVMDNSESNLTRKERATMESTLDNIGTAMSYSSDDVVTCLLQDGYMIPAQNQLEALEIDNDDLVDSQSLDLPKPLTKLWQPLLMKMNSTQQIEPFLQELLKEALGAGPVRARLLNGWVYTILQAASHPGGRVSQDGELIFSEPGYVDWQGLFDHCIEQPDVYNRNLLPCIMKNLDPPPSEENQASILKLIDLVVEEREEGMETNEEGAATCSTDYLEKCKHLSSEDPRSGFNSTDKLPSFKTSGWQLCTEPIDWSKYPLGECPGVTLAYTNLEIMRNENEDDQTSYDEEDSAVRGEHPKPVDSTVWSEKELNRILEEVDLL
ncbi:ribosomal biogenesis protein LAS1L-like [Lineus longissimus]|uniref:ribosomal biogenesis protein LAS1L-like n=1 Tax=Lineus longissimus TaxID=88925 RepID=UPI00315C9939